MGEVRITVLGTAQDGGFPQPGCSRECCQRVRMNKSLRRHPVSLGIMGLDGSTHLIEASRHMGEQFEIWPDYGSIEEQLSSVSITHAHLGHIDGLGLFGKEVMGLKHLKVHCSQSVAALIERNPIWNSLCEQEVIQPIIWTPNVSFEPSQGCGFTIRAIPVPHRDELSDNHALLIESAGQNLLFMPDHDTWDGTLGGTSIRQWLRDLNVNIALIDGTFWDQNELKHRDMSEIPHPTVRESIERLGSKMDDDVDIRFIHFNHTNPLCNPESDESAELASNGWLVANEGDSFTLERL